MSCLPREGFKVHRKQIKQMKKAGRGDPISGNRLKVAEAVVLRKVLTRIRY